MINNPSNLWKLLQISQIKKMRSLVKMKIIFISQEKFINNKNENKIFLDNYLREIKKLSLKDQITNKILVK